MNGVRRCNCCPWVLRCIIDISDMLNLQWRLDHQKFNFDRRWMICEQHLGPSEQNVVFLGAGQWITVRTNEHFWREKSPGGVACTVEVSSERLPCCRGDPEISGFSCNWNYVIKKTVWKPGEEWSFYRSPRQVGDGEWFWYLESSGQDIACGTWPTKGMEPWGVGHLNPNIFILVA